MTQSKYSSVIITGMNLSKSFSCGVTRHTNRSFTRVKLGKVHETRNFAAHVYESPEEAMRLPIYKAGCRQYAA